MQWRSCLQCLARFLRSCRTLVLYPYTWAVLALILVTHLSFSWWFQPAPAMQRLAVGLDLLALLLWGILAVRSESWRAWHNRMPYEATPRQVQKVLADCPPTFAVPARQCLELARHISQELDTLITNMARLAQAHRTLHLRAQRFGTPEQKTSMAAMLHKHILSAENTLKTLQAFSGNLTLLSASVATDERATQELHFMNQGLQEVLQEFNDAHR